MSERKVLNKYYPPDFDPNNIPRAKRAKNQTFNIRLMAPFNMRCKTCGEYIYKGKKFNSRKENVENEFYLGIQIYRFYIKCPMCIAEISFRTDPENTDYEIESGATRNFEALRTAEKMAIQEEKERKEAENSDPMKLLESRTKASRHEMEELEALEDLRELRRKQQLIDSNDLIVVNKKLEPIEEDLDEDEKELEETIKYHFGCIKRVAPIDSADPPTKMPKLETFKKPIVTTASKKTLDVYDKIRACIKPKVKVEKKEPEEEVKAPQLPALPTSAICASTPEPLKIAVSVEEPTESAQSSLKLIDYSDSDEE